ncbi:sigma-70 family RNA polymerase sigma factor [uncultured Imperialibacter sp.]|uniref:RNA polymerase sigma factor n=1 Tax=uncultured Imperialibacter sp. TaxID=1672639 RepID=UPI0030DDAD72|tara:strand:+ start:5621 stop:6175 length:555 start_codon:yes stop_codon:yes gene_type:complete
MLRPQLVEAIKNGDKEAFEELYHNYFQRVYFFAFKICKSKEIAEEITQDTFITIWNKRNSLDITLSLEGFIYKIARDFSFKQLQKIARVHAIEADLKELISNLDNSTQDDISFRECLRNIEAVMDKLPKKRKEIFQRRIMDQQSIKIISENMGISENTTKTQLLKATRFVREQLGSILSITLFL